MTQTKELIFIFNTRLKNLKVTEIQKLDQN